MGTKERAGKTKEDQEKAKRMYNKKRDDLERQKAICGVGLMRDRESEKKIKWIKCHKIIDFRRER